MSQLIASILRGIAMLLNVIAFMLAVPAWMPNRVDPAPEAYWAPQREVARA